MSVFPSLRCLYGGSQCLPLLLYSISQSHIFHYTIIFPSYLGLSELLTIFLRLSSSCVRLFFYLFRLEVKSPRLCQKYGMVCPKASILVVACCGLVFGFILLESQEYKLFAFFMELRPESFEL